MESSMHGKRIHNAQSASAGLIKRGLHRLKKIKVSSVLVMIFILLMVLFSLLPVIYSVSNAFKPIDELFIYPPRFFARNPTLDNFAALFTAVGNSIVPFSRYIYNSIIVTVASVLLTVVITTMAAYAVSKLKMKYAGLYFNIIIMALMFSPYVTQIPRYLIVSQLNLLDTVWALVIPGLATSFNLFLVKQFIDQFPDALLEAAKIDGSSEYGIFFRIVVPNLKPAIATLVVFTFNTYWNDGMSPLIYVTQQALKTLPIGLGTIGGGGIGRAGAVAAASLLASLPTVIVFIVMQTKVVETMTYSGIKA